MKFIRVSSFAAVAGAVAAGALLFWTSQRVQGLEDRLARDRAALAREEQTIRVLRAEWAYLNAPDRLESLAAAYLDLDAPATILPDGDLPPLSAQASAGFEVQDVPALSVQAAAASARMKAPPVPASRPASLGAGRGSFQALLDTVRKDEGGALR